MERIEAEWLRAPAVVAAFDALGGEEGRTRAVGGAVRNAILGEPSGDVDLATELRPEEVIRRTESAGLKAVPTGIEHGTVTVVAQGRPIEVTTLREDVETDGRHAVVRFGTDWARDAQRRDFTMNAIYCGPDGTLFDPAGGLPDALSRAVRFIGDPRQRIAEDYLRILRFFRLHAWYGKGRPDAEGLRASAAMKGGLEFLSIERVWSEVKRTLAAPDPLIALRWMRTINVLSLVLPESERWGIDALPGLVAAERALGLDPDPLRRLMAAVPPDEARMIGLARRLKMSNEERERLVAWSMAPLPADIEEARRAAYVGGREAVLDRVILSAAGAQDETRRSEMIELAARLQSSAPSRFPLAGRDLLERGHAPGPQLGKLLKRLEAEWIESGFELTREELLARADESADAESGT